MLAESRKQALDRIIQEAENKGADGILCLHFTTSAVMHGLAELLVYCPAVRLKKNNYKKYK